MGKKQLENGGKSPDTLRTFYVPLLLDSRVQRF